MTNTNKISIHEPLDVKMFITENHQGVDASSVICEICEEDRLDPFAVKPLAVAFLVSEYSDTSFHRIGVCFAHTPTHLEVRHAE